jgi:hypothetical protein
MSPGRHVLNPPQEEELMFTSVLNRAARHRRLPGTRKRGPIAVEINSAAIAYTVWMLALVVAQVTS